MKRILIFSLSYYPYVGGAEIAIKEITDRIAPEEIEFHMVTRWNDSNLPQIERVGNVVVHRIGPKKKGATLSDLQKMPLRMGLYRYQLFAAGYAKKLEKNYSYDAIWAMMAHSTGIPAGMFKKEHPSIPYLLTLQEGDPLEYIEKTMRPAWSLFKNGFVRAEYLQAISTFLLAWGTRMGFTGRGVVIPNGVDTALFAKEYSKEDIEQYKDILGKKEGDVFLVTTSRLVSKNAVDDVLRALPSLAPNIYFLIYGIGPDEQMLKNLVQELHVEDRVRFMGHITHEEMPRMLRACDIFIRPSRSEGMGNSFIEAMAAGIPVIATQEGGISDFLYDAKRNPNNVTTGWAVDANAPTQIIEAVQNILSDRATVERVTKNAKNVALEKYDWNIIAREMRNLFEEMMREHIVGTAS